MWTGLEELTDETRGDPRVSVALLDGLVDTNHPCFQGANLEILSTLVQDRGPAGGMAAHGTHIASLLFGQPGSPIEGVAPGCRGLIIPVFSDDRRHLPQMDLARAITQAVEAGAHLINISGGQKVEGAEADDFLAKAVRLCEERGVLIVAAAGNDGCDCLHVPAALPAVLAVGAMDDEGRPLPMSNWGAAYQEQGILAPGAGIRGAKPGGGTYALSGTSFAAPIVTGAAALLLSLQIARGERPDPVAVRRALLASASPCEEPAGEGERRCLAGRLNVPAAMKSLRNGEETMADNQVSKTKVAEESVQPSGCACGGVAPNQGDDDDDDDEGIETSSAVVASGASKSAATPDKRAGVRPSRASSQVEGVRPSSGSSLVYALGVLGYDFGSEARRDTFKQLMPAVKYGDVPVPSNPYDARQMVDYLKENLSEARSLVWTLNMELTPLYALEAEGPFARDVYQVLQRVLDGQVQAESSKAWIERVSIPGRLSGRSVRLFSGQVVPVISIDAPRGLYGWNVNALQDAAITAVKKSIPDAKEQVARKALSSFLYQVYYKLRNLGQSSQDRALNFAATNAFQVASVFGEAVGAGMELDDIEVKKSPFCRMDSDCWDVTLAFFDTENLMRARKRFQFTIDVSDVIPVSLGEVRSWSSR
jgi:cyanobactin maturation PatA/PatG family protease